jgi:hypothetical protein
MLLDEHCRNTAFPSYEIDRLARSGRMIEVGLLLTRFRKYAAISSLGNIHGPLGYGWNPGGALLVGFEPFRTSSRCLLTVSRSIPSSLAIRRLVHPR